VFKVVNEPFAAAVIYPAVLAAWTYLALFFVDRPLGRVISAIVFVVEFAGNLALRQVPQGSSQPSPESPGHELT
jgi:hypothetical protein